MSTSVFVSFADRKGDREFVQLLMTRLNDQPLRAWNYQGEMEEISGGTPVLDRLRQEIDSCQAFFPVLSPNAFESCWVTREVAYAIHRQNDGAPLKIVPIVSAKLPIDYSWPKPFNRLLAVRCRQIDFEVLDIEDLVVDLCRDMEVEYQPLLPAHDRLPYRERFLHEIQEAYRTERAKPRRTDRERAVFEVLMRLLGEFGAAIRANRDDDALRIIRLFCLTCEHEYPELQLYYPYVARGAWELQMGDVQAAERTFLDLLQRPEADESTFAALGQVCLGRGENEQALNYFRRARERCPSDPATVSNEILAMIMCGVPIDLATTLGFLDDLSPAVGWESDHIQEVKAHAYKNAGPSHFVHAERLYRDLVHRGVAMSPTLLDYAGLLRDQHRHEEAFELLRPCAHDRADTNLVIEVARLAEHCGKFDEAERMWNVLRERDPLNWWFILELATVYWRDGRTEFAEQLLAALITDDSRLPRTAEDFYCLGAAQWLCGNRTLAEYDFQRSRFASSLHYARVFA